MIDLTAPDDEGMHRVLSTLLLAMFSGGMSEVVIPKEHIEKAKRILAEGDSPLRIEYTRDGDVQITLRINS